MVLEWAIEELEKESSTIEMQRIRKGTIWLTWHTTLLRKIGVSNLGHGLDDKWAYLLELPPVYGLGLSFKRFTLKV